MKRAAVLCLLASLLPGSRLYAQDDAVPLRGLVVTASPTPRPADAVATHVTVLHGDDLRATGVLTLQDALRDVPGVSVVRNGSYGSTSSVFLRGGESDYVLVLVDGVQVNQPGGAFDFSSLTLANVERIEVVRGPASALYGSDAVAGVVHIITRSGRGEPRGSASARAGSYGRRAWSASVSGGGENAGYSISLDRMSTEGILAFNNAHVNNGVSGSFRFEPDRATTAKLSVRLTDREYHFPTDGSGEVIDRNAFTFADETVAGLALTRRVSHAVDLKVLLGLSQTAGGTDDASDGPADSLGFFAFASLDHVRRATADVRSDVRVGGAMLTAGWEVEEERQRSFTETQSQYGPGGGRSDFSRWNRAFYTHVTGETGTLAYNAGARLERNERFGSFATWEVGAVVPAPGLASTRLRGSLGRAIKEPTFFENFATGFAVGNPDLAPERTRSWEIGVDQGLWRGRVRLSGSYFDQAFQDLIQYTFVPPEPGAPNYFNIAAADARGWEVSLRAQAGPWSASASGTWLHTEVIEAGFEQGPGASFVMGQALLRRPARQFSASAGRSLGAVGVISAGLTRVGVRSDRDFSGWPARAVELPAYTTVHVGGELTLRQQTAGRPGFTLLLRADNLTDASHQEVFGFPAPGRSLVIGGRLDIGGSG